MVAICLGLNVLRVDSGTHYGVVDDLAPNLNAKASAGTLLILTDLDLNRPNYAIVWYRWVSARKV